MNNKWNCIKVAGSIGILAVIVAGCANPRGTINGTESGMSGSGSGSEGVAAQTPASDASNSLSASQTDQNGNLKTDDSPESGSVPQIGPDAVADTGPVTGTFSGLDGKQYDLAKLRGQVVVVDYWAPWCPPCRLGLPFTQRMSDTFKGKGLVVIAATLDPSVPGSNDTLAGIKSFVKSNKYTLPVALDRNADFMRNQSINGIPATFFINKDGTIVAKEVGLAPQSDSIANLKKAGLDVGNFAPKDDPTQGQ